jgi:hypothetical protein
VGRTLAVLAAVLAWAPATASGRPRPVIDSDPVTEALQRAADYWGGAPCHGALTVTLAEPVEPDASMWTPVVATPAEEGAMVTCPIYLSRQLWPNWYVDDLNFEVFCKTLVHEVGHYEGHADEGAAPGTVEYEFPEWATVPQCERYRLVYGHRVFTPPRVAWWVRGA